MTVATKKKPTSERMRLIDPVYKKFTAKAFQTMTSSEFYDYFMATMSRGQHEFQFSNRKVDKKVDERWVEEIELALPAMEAVSRDPRIIITQEELVTNVVLAKKIDSQVVRHLCAHANLIETITDDGEVIPSKVLNLFKEESWDTYENRFVFTLIKKTFEFVDLRYQKLFEQMDDEFGAHLKIDSQSSTSMETIKIKSDLHINQVDDLLATDGKHETIFSRIARIHRILAALMNARFAQEMSKMQKVKPPLVPTNAIKKNPYLRKCNRLWNFLLEYMDIGYTINIVEQNPEINPKFEQDIFNNIMFNYIILKGYLEDNRDRAVDYKMKAKRKQLKPKYIKEIIEEIVKDYDLPDIEIRKVLIEELTKAQLLQEEEEERNRLLAEKEKEMKEKKRQEEREAARLQKEKEKEEKRIAREKEQERQRKLKEIEAEKERKRKEKERKEAFELRLGTLFAKELEEQKGNIAPFLANREKQRQLAAEAAAKAEKARLAAEERARKEKAAEERRLKKEAEELERQKREDAERIRNEAEAKAKLAEEKAHLAAEKKAQQEAAAQARKLERERARAEAMAQKTAEAASKLEQERLALEEQARLEAQRIAQEEEAQRIAEEKLAEEERLRQEKLEEDERLRQEAEARRIEEERMAKLRAEEEVKAAKERQLQEIEAIVEKRTAAEFPKSGLGRGKNARVKKKLEQKFKAEIREEELVRAGLKAPKEVPKPVVEEPAPQIEEVPVVEELTPEVEEPQAEPTSTEEKPSTLRGAFERQWKKWRS